MDPKPVQIDFDWLAAIWSVRTADLTSTYVHTILRQSRVARILRKLAFDPSQSPMQLVDMTKVQPSVKKRTREADDGNYRRAERDQQRTRFDRGAM